MYIEWMNNQMHELQIYYIIYVLLLEQSFFLYVHIAHQHT
jgi:hypothetical protein